MERIALKTVSPPTSDSYLVWRFANLADLEVLLDGAALVDYAVACLDLEGFDKDGLNFDAPSVSCFRSDPQRLALATDPEQVH